MNASRAATIGPEALQAVDLFRGLSLAERKEIARRCAGAHFAPGEHLVLQHAGETDVFFILSGTVRVTFHSKPGKDVQFRDQEAGEYFGELAAIDGRPRSADVEALTEVFVAALPAEDFLDIATRYPSVARKIFEQFAGRIRSLSDRVVELSTLGVNNRIHAELLRLARQHGIDDNHAEIRPAPTHADIASRVSTHREAVTKELGALEKGGVLERARGVLRVVDVGRLESMVQNVAEV